MPIQLNEENNGKLLAIHVSGKLVKDDYAEFVPSDSSSSTESCACCST